MTTTSPRHRLRALLVRGRIGRAVAVVAGGQALAQLIVIATMPILTRLYGPVEFGVYGAATSMVFLVVTVTCVMYDQPIPVPRDDETAADLVIVALIGAVVVTAATSLMLLVAGRPLLAAVNASPLWPYVWLLPIAQFGGALYLAFNSLAIRRQDFGATARARVTQSAVMVGIQTAAGVLGAGPAGLLGGDAAGRVSAGASLGYRGIRAMAATFRTSRPARLARAAARYRRFPLIGTWPALMNSAGLAAPILMMVALYGAEPGGLYAFANRLVAAPVGLIVSSVGAVYTSEAARLLNAQPEGLQAFYRRTLRRMSTRVGPLVLLAIPASLLVGPIFGSAWREAGLYIAILTPMFFAQVLASPFSGTLTVIERQDLWFLRESIRLVLVSGAIAGAAALSAPVIWAVVAVSFAGTLSYAAFGAITWYGVNEQARRR